MRRGTWTFVLMHKTDEGSDLIGVFVTKHRAEQAALQEAGEYLKWWPEYDKIVKIPRGFCVAEHSWEIIETQVR